MAGRSIRSNTAVSRTFRLAAGCFLALAFSAPTYAQSQRTKSKSRFEIGAYLGNPNGSNPSLEAQFEASFASLASLLKTKPKLINGYVDYTQTVANWASNASWQAWSNAQSPVARIMTPVIGFPMASIAQGSLSPDQQFQAFAAGTYDSVIQGVVQAWTSHGFQHLIMRPGWEMNLPGPTYAGDDPQSQADWVAAFRHIYTVLHAAAAASGASMKVIWNPGVTNYSNAEATTSLYPGDASADEVGADIYAGMYPFMDTDPPPTYHDWDTGQEDTSVAQFIADPINRAHYWTYPAATEWSNDGSGGHSQSLTSLTSFALQHGKPFAIPETGAGNSDSGTDVSDEATFPQWLAQTLAAFADSGGTVAFVNLWDVNSGYNYEFSFPDDNKPQEAQAWATWFGKP